MSEDRRTIQNWAARLSAKDEPLTMAEAQLLASISAADRLVEIQGRVEDQAERLRRLEEQATPGVLVAFGWLGEVVAVLRRLHFWLAGRDPSYPAGDRALAALMEGRREEPHPHG